MSLEQAFIDAIRASGIEPPSEIIADGRLHRFRSVAGKRELDGFYTLFPDEPASGVYGCWKRHIKEKWCYKSGGESNLTEAERAIIKERIEKAQKQRDAERAKAQAEASKTAAFIWGQCGEADQDFPYLKQKGILPHGTRVTRKSEKYSEQSLVIPVWSVSGNNAKGELISLQFIRKDGSKNFLGGGAIASGFFHIGKLKDAKIVICEGFATGASIHEATGMLVIVAFNGNNLVNAAKAIRAKYPDATIILAADDDWKTEGNPGVSCAEHAAKEVGGLVAVPMFDDFLRKEKDTDFNDLFRLAGAESVSRCIELAVVPHAKPQQKIEARDDKSWQDRLVFSEDKNGKVTYAKNLANVATVLEHHPEWVGVLAFDAFSGCSVALKMPPSHVGKIEIKKFPHQWNDTDDIMATIWLQKLDPCVAYDIKTTSWAVDAVSRLKTIHPVVDYLNSLKWDGKKRLDSWLVEYLGCSALDDTGNYSESLEKYLKVVGSKWMISAVARVMSPGCKADQVIILEGGQGAGKSTALRVLAGEDWFTDQIADIGSKDADMQLEGVWIVELAELDALSRHPSSRNKGFITRTFERYIKKWGKRASKVERQFVFSGTTNHETYFGDATGDRRYWPVRCNAIDLEMIKRDRDQLWAEATRRFKAGEAYYLELEDKEVTQQQQDKRFVVDAWEEVIECFLAKKQRVTMSMILKLALNIATEKWGQREQNRVSAILKRLGWTRKQIRLKTGEVDELMISTKEGRAWVYERSEQQ